jgi:hypothetical protein
VNAVTPIEHKAGKNSVTKKNIFHGLPFTSSNLPQTDVFPAEAGPTDRTDATRGTGFSRESVLGHSAGLEVASIHA